MNTMKNYGFATYLKYQDPGVVFIVWVSFHPWREKMRVFPLESRNSVGKHRYEMKVLFIYWNNNHYLVFKRLIKHT